MARVTEATATGRLHLLNEHGDTPVLWDVKDQASVDEAIKVFETELAKGKAAYEIKTDGTREIVKQFPENAERVVMIPALQGG